MLLESPNLLTVEGPLHPTELDLEEWTALWRRVSGASVFQSPPWITEWWHTFGGPHPWILAMRRNGRLVAVVPLFLWPEARLVLLIGTGITDSLDLLAEDTHAHAAAEAALHWLESVQEQWRMCDFQQLPATSPLTAVPAPLWTDNVGVQDTVPVLTLPRTPAEIPRADELAYLHRRLAKEGTVEFATGTVSNFDELFAVLVRLHAARWEERDQHGMLAESRIEAFHRSVMKGLLQLGALRLHVLKVAGRGVAAYYGFQHAGRAVYYLGGFDPAWKRFSVGTLIVGHAISEAVIEGATEFDFGRGREPYKYRWGAEDRSTYRRELRA